jgi:hypothetical protein
MDTVDSATGCYLVYAFKCSNVQTLLLISFGPDVARPRTRVNTTLLINPCHTDNRLAGSQELMTLEEYLAVIS